MVHKREFVLNIKRYIVVWLRLSHMSLLMQLTNCYSSFGWLLGKIIRLFFFFILMFVLFKKIDNVLGFSSRQIVICFLTCNVIDITVQMLLRGLYMIGRDIRDGDFDFYLLHPISPLFRVASNSVDFLDFLMLIPTFIVCSFFVRQELLIQPLQQQFTYLIGYILLCINGLIIAICLHVIIASITVKTQQMENTIWLYRDVAGLGRFPIQIYNFFMEIFLTFVIPIALMTTYPMLMLSGSLQVHHIFILFLVTTSFVWLSIKMWHMGLKNYCSVSS